MTAFVLFGPVLEHWENIVGRLALDFRVTGWKDVAFRRDEEAGFREFIHDLYPSHSRKRIERKCDDLAPYPLAVRIVTAIGDEEKRHIVKCRIREEYAATAQQDLYITIHSSDADDEARMFWAMTRPTSLMHAKARKRATEGFLARAAAAKEDIDAAGIGSSSVCVVGGGVLEAMGIRKANDFDVIVPAALRDKARFRSLDLAAPWYSRGEVSDDAIIADPRHHFWADGLKFAALDIVQARKAASKREKDAADVALMADAAR